MDVQITVRVCDICKRQDRPAIRYTLKPENGEAKTRDLCAVDVAPVEAVFGPLEQAEKAKSGPLYLNAEVEGEPTPRRKRTVAKKAAAPAQRRTGRTKVMTLEEIEALKSDVSQS